MIENLDKKILVIFTGGTIGCVSKSVIDSREFEGEVRSLDGEISKKLIIKAFCEGKSKYAPIGEELFVDSGFTAQTLSENMTPERLDLLINHIKEFDLDEFAGVVILHGTDTLAYTANLFSMLFCNINVPMIFVSGNRPPEDKKTNAHANFQAAVTLIMDGIAPNIYAVYRNSDEKTRLYLGSQLMGCENFSEDFRSASKKGAFKVSEKSKENKKLLAKCEDISDERFSSRVVFMDTIKKLDDAVLLLKPYMGMNYERVNVDGVKAVVLGTYHSDTMCVDSGSESRYSVKHLAKKCAEKDIPVFAAPCRVGDSQYESTLRALAGSDIIPLSCTSEMAYSKAVLACSIGFMGEEITKFVEAEINSEFVK